MCIKNKINTPAKPASKLSTLNSQLSTPVKAGCTVLLLGLSVLLWVLAGRNPEGIARVFGPWSQWVSLFLGRVFSYTRFAVSEIVLYLLILLFLATLVRSVIRAVRGRSARPLLSWLSTVALAVAAFVFVMFSLWGLNNRAPTLAGRLEARAEARPVDLLYETTLWVRDEMNRLASQVPRDSDGVTDAGGFNVLAPLAADGYNELANEFDVFYKGAPPPKRLLFPTLLARFGVAGIYVPFTGEPVVDNDAPDAHLPFTMSHEMAHRMGFAPEDEANYIAFLACIRNPDPVYQYSGYHSAFIYCVNALGRANAELSGQVWAEVSPLVAADLRAQHERIKAYEGPLRAVGEAVNDTFLQAMGQEEGVKSYGMVVDLLIAEYLVRFGT